MRVTPPQDLQRRHKPSSIMNPAWLLFLLGLQASVGASRELVLELLDPTCGVNVLQLAGVKRVASVANVDADFGSSAACLEGIPTTAGDVSFVVFGMNAVLHRSLC